jgi:hypothetical protein
MKALLAFALCLGCQQSKQPPAATASGSAPAASGSAPAASPRRELCVVSLAMFERFVDTGDPSATPEQVKQVKIAILDRCVQDNWSDAALACMRDAKEPHATFKCWDEQLTKEQRAKVSEALGSLAPAK